jgi:2-polyprenyl-3-methyl-5-hydroxy-6-metoxy-1,4-benzoquinol methylase
MSLIVAPCAVCGGTEFVLKYPRTIRDSDDDPALYYSSSRARAGYLDVVRCAGCGLLMTNPRDDDETIARVYGALHDATYDEEDETRRRTALAFLDLVEAHHPARGRLLDVGCATGLFVTVAQESGWIATGVEASHWAVERARQRCRDATFIQGLLERVELPPASFQVVTLWDVLEHVRSPAETLTRVRHWLAPEGRLFLNLPNAGSLTARGLGRHWMLLLREHLWYFDPATMARLLGQCGLELVETRPNSVNFSMRNVLVRAAQYRGVAGRLARGLASAPLMTRVHVRFRIGEMQVVAKPLLSAAATRITRPPCRSSGPKRPMRSWRTSRFAQRTLNTHAAPLISRTTGTGH